MPRLPPDCGEGGGEAESIMSRHHPHPLRRVLRVPPPPLEWAQNVITAKPLELNPMEVSQVLCDLQMLRLLSKLMLTQIIIRNIYELFESSN